MIPLELIEDYLIDQDEGVKRLLTWFLMHRTNYRYNSGSKKLVRITGTYAPIPM
jgi:hypothetical protein